MHTVYTGIHPVEGGKPTPPPPPREGERERGREKERKGGRGENILFGAVKVISNPLVKLFLRTLDKTTEYP